MKLSRPDLAAYALVALCLLVLTVLTVLGKSVPDVVTYLAVTALGVGGGVAIQGSTSGASPSSAPPPPPRRPAPPLGSTADPAATGVFRVARHEP